MVVFSLLNVNWDKNRKEEVKLEEKVRGWAFKLEFIFY